MRTLKPVCAVILMSLFLGACSKQRGHLASPGLDNKPIKAILYFAGEQLDGKFLPQNVCFPPTNIIPSCETQTPSDPDLHDWINPANRIKALNRVVNLGFNTITMSSWGESTLPCTVSCPYIPKACCGPNTCTNSIPRCGTLPDGSQQCKIGWYGSANTQLSPAAKDELFDAVLQTPLQIIPSIESRFAYEWNFRTDFPYSQDSRTLNQLAPGLISQVEDLLNLYVIHPRNPSWKDHWALVYDKNGQKRRAVAIVQAASDSLGPNDDRKFAEAFDQVAYRIYQDTGIMVGFFIDPIARNPTRTFGNFQSSQVKTYFLTSFRPDPDSTGPFLLASNSILGIDSYSPEGWIDGTSGPVNENFKIAWKYDYSNRWNRTGIPFLQDVTPGYDGRIIFKGMTGLHVWGYDPPWRAALLDMTQKYGRNGMIYNSWNGYCEGLAGMETIQQKTANVDFIGTLMATY
jgi:hypothetical protein